MSDDQMLALVRATRSGYDPARALQRLDVPALHVPIVVLAAIDRFC
jgi:hypothetical protein